MAARGIVVSARDTPAPHRRWLDVVFALFLASGVMVGAYSLWAIADWIHSQGEDAFGMYYLGVLSFVPTLLAFLAGGGYTFMASRNRDVRLGVALTTAHLVWWLLLIGIELWREDPSWGWGMRSRYHRRAMLLRRGDDMPGRTLVPVAAASRSRGGRGIVIAILVDDEGAVQVLPRLQWRPEREGRWQDVVWAFVERLALRCPQCRGLWLA